MLWSLPTGGAVQSVPVIMLSSMHSALAMHVWHDCQKLPLPKGIRSGNRPFAQGLPFPPVCSPAWCKASWLSSCSRNVGLSAALNPNQR